MTTIACGLCLLAVLAGVSYVVLGLWVAVRRDEKCRCPGPERFAVPGYRNPLRWFITRRCGYDLRGGVFNDQDETTCPECGTVIARSRLCRDGMRVRPLSCGVLLVFVGVCLLRSGWFTLADVAKETPTSALIVVQDVLSQATPEPVRAELGERISGTALDAWQTAEAVELLIRDLRDDRVSRNGKDALELLAMLGDDAISGLEQALHSDDYQQRQYAAHVLRGHFGYHPSERMLEVCVEALANRDGVRNNARESADYLIAHADEAEPLLVQGLTSNDPLRRLLCAAILGCAGRTEQADLIAPILISHLADNNVTNDAVVAQLGLRGMGEAARPYLLGATNAADLQLRRSANQLIEALDDAILRAKAGAPAGPSPPIQLRGVWLINFNEGWDSP